MVKIKVASWICLVIVLSINMISIDIYLPSMSKMVIDLATTPFILKLIFIINFLELSFSPLIFGSFSDIYGRKPTIYICLTLAFIGQFLSAFAHNAYLLMTARIVQYLGAGALGSIIITLICDNFEGTKRAKAIAIYEIALPFAFALGPFIGAYILNYGGWQFSFLLLACIQMACMIGIIFTYSESLINFQKTNFQHSINCISEILKDRISTSIIFILGLIEGGWMIFTISVAFFYINTFKISLTYYAYYQSAPVICFLLGASIYRFLVDKFSPIKMFHYNVIGYLSPAVFLLFFRAKIIVPSPLTLSIVCCVMNFFSGVICPSGNSIILDRVNKNLLGTSAGVITCLINLIVGVSMLISNYIVNSDLSNSFYNCLIIFMILIGVLWLNLKRYSSYNLNLRKIILEKE